MAQIGLLEDNAVIAGMCAAFLGYAGHHVAVFDTPEECLRALFCVEVGQGVSSSSSSSMPGLPVDILILDLGLPQVDGVDILRYLVGHPRTRLLPIVLFTAAGQREVLRAMQVAPGVGIVEKPFKMSALVAAIEKALNTAPILHS